MRPSTWPIWLSVPSSRRNDRIWTPDPPFPGAPCSADSAAVPAVPGIARARAAALGAGGAVAPRRSRRCGWRVLYMANGVNVDQWTPTGRGRDFELSPTLSPLADYKDDLLVFSELWNQAARNGDGHYVKSAGFLTGTTITKTTGKDIRSGAVSMDQLAGPAHRRAHAAAVAGAGHRAGADRRRRQRRLHAALQLAHLLGDADDAGRQGDQPAARVRPAVPDQPAGGRGQPLGARPGRRAGARPCGRKWAARTRRSWTTTSTRSGRSRSGSSSTAARRRAEQDVAGAVDRDRGRWSGGSRSSWTTPSGRSSPPASAAARRGPTTRSTSASCST